MAQVQKEDQRFLKMEQNKIVAFRCEFEKRGWDVHYAVSADGRTASIIEKRPFLDARLSALYCDVKLSTHPELNELLRNATVLAKSIDPKTPGYELIKCFLEISVKLPPGCSLNPLRHLRVNDLSLEKIEELFSRTSSLEGLLLEYSKRDTRALIEAIEGVCDFEIGVSAHKMNIEPVVPIDAPLLQIIASIPDWIKERIRVKKMNAALAEKKRELEDQLNKIPGWREINALLADDE